MTIEYKYYVYVLAWLQMSIVVYSLTLWRPPYPLEERAKNNIFNVP